MPLPAPRTWTDGEEPENYPSADALNTDWRDSFDFLIGTTKPLIFLAHSSAQAITSTASAINMQVEIVKRGGMVHAANAALVTVPYTGMYQGFFLASYQTYSTSATRSIAFMQINSVTNGPRSDISPVTTLDGQLHGSFTLKLNANDTVRLMMSNTTGTVNTNISSVARTQWAMWYAGDAV